MKICHNLERVVKIDLLALVAGYLGVLNQVESPQNVGKIQ